MKKVEATRAAGGFVSLAAWVMSPVPPDIGFVGISHEDDRP